MDFGIAGKRALVLGASRGLGAACAEALVAEGVQVIALSRSGNVPPALQGKVTAKALDLSDAAATAAFCEELRAGPVDILVNNCGGPKAGPARGQSAEAWRAAFDAMATPVFALTDAALEGMAAAKWGRIVTIGSSGVQAPIPGLALSNGVRGAMAGWSKTLAAEVAPLGITVNMVLPGRIATDRVAELDAIKAKATGQEFEAVQAASRATIPAGRYGTPAEFAAMVAFLCSQQAGYVTGAMMRVDGGMIRGL
ncbi:SDR family oxidoreductase [Gemmobacter nectariphilus]|uniref:SDR family oxidoreductase n=1 Tax=Gemmobacter nectariphilus TaxID=220343 RepID=UPI000401BE49|nr:SDR family oxidoreductase [Gemmobacter nectariphilus]